MASLRSQVSRSPVESMVLSALQEGKRRLPRITVDDPVLGWDFESTAFIRTEGAARSDSTSLWERDRLGSSSVLQVPSPMGKVGKAAAADADAVEFDMIIADHPVADCSTRLSSRGVDAPCSMAYSS